MIPIESILNQIDRYIVIYMSCKYAQLIAQGAFTTCSRRLLINLQSLHFDNFADLAEQKSYCSFAVLYYVCLC